MGITSKLLSKLHPSRQVPWDDGLLFLPGWGGFFVREDVLNYLQAIADTVTCVVTSVVTHAKTSNPKFL